MAAIPDHKDGLMASIDNEIWAENPDEAVKLANENVGFRQMHAWWRLKGLIDYLKGNKEWGVMVRKGIG